MDGFGILLLLEGISAGHDPSDLGEMEECTEGGGGARDCTGKLDGSAWCIVREVHVPSYQLPSLVQA